MGISTDVGHDSVINVLLIALKPIYMLLNKVLSVEVSDTTGVAK